MLLSFFCNCTLDVTSIYTSDVSRHDIAASYNTYVLRNVSVYNDNLYMSLRSPLLTRSVDIWNAYVFCQTPQIHKSQFISLLLATLMLKFTYFRTECHQVGTTKPHRCSFLLHVFLKQSIDYLTPLTVFWASYYDKDTLKEECVMAWACPLEKRLPPKQAVEPNHLFTRGVHVLRSPNFFSRGMEADRNVKVVGGDVTVL